MMEVRCDECGKVLFLTSKTSKGEIGCIAQQKGFVYKNAVLFSEDYTSLYFCNNKCAKDFYQKNIPRNPEVTKMLDEAKRNIAQSSKEISIKMAGLTNVLRKNGFIK